MESMKLHSPVRNAEQGSVISEFAILVPMLLVFFLGLIGVGQLLGHLTWVSQTTYAGALLGADIPQNEGPTKILTQSMRLKALQDRGQISSQAADFAVNTVYTNGSVTGKPIINVSIGARNVSAIAKAVLPMNLDVSVAAPYLVPNQSLFSTYSDFSNPPGVTGCTGIGCGGATGTGPVKVKALEFYPETFADSQSDGKYFVDKAAAGEKVVADSGSGGLVSKNGSFVFAD